MEQTIVLRDDSDDIRLELSNSAENSQIYLTIYHGKLECSGKFSIDELRLALRKLATK